MGGRFNLLLSVVGALIIRQESLNGLSVVMTPGWDNANGVTGWTRNCNIQSDSALQQACEDVFRFDDAN